MKLTKERPSSGFFVTVWEDECGTYSENWFIGTDPDSKPEREYAANWIKVYEEDYEGLDLSYVVMEG